jgi:hypothetical protein
MFETNDADPLQRVLDHAARADATEGIAKD